jgi:UDP-N-acetylglucosamine 2-epimerase (non-hydrolysing)
MKKVLLIFGTRPEAIKMAPVINELKNCGSQINYKVCVTAQHREMLDQVLDLFDIKPDYDLDLMSKNQDLFDVTTSVLSHTKNIINEFMPDIVLVHGDTTTSMAASLASFYLKVDVGHVEAGLRTGDIYSPWPEELNRKVTADIAAIHFAPTDTAKLNLLNEGVPETKIYVVGNTSIDALKTILDKFDSDEQINKKTILITAHRRENFNSGIIGICEAIHELSILYPEVDFIYPVHLNPNIKKPVYRMLTGLDNVQLIEPLDYLPFVSLMKKSYIILTDSGGIQEEAPSLGKPVLVLRDTTERPEAVLAGTVRVIGNKKEDLVKHVSLLLDNRDKYNEMSFSHNPYGDGNAAKYIVNILKNKPYKCKN